MRSKWLDTCIGCNYFASSFLLFYESEEVIFKKKGKIEQCRYPTILTEQAWQNEDLLLAKR